MISVKNLHILFADDEKFFMRGTIEVLMAQAFKVTVVTNGFQVLQYLRENKSNLPDLIILDIMMPEGSPEIQTNDNGRSTGVVVYHKIREELGLNIPILISTVIDDPNIQNGFNGDRRVEKINKPYICNELIDKIIKLFEEIEKNG